MKQPELQNRIDSFLDSKADKFPELFSDRR